MTPPQADPFAVPLSGLQLIEASAGTGKTFNLAGLYLRLVIERAASVREILVMTFTRAATQELRERIRRRLVDAARIADDRSAAVGGDPEHDYACRVLDASPDAPDALARRLAEAAAAVDEAAIVTIHGFAQRAAADNAFDSALAFDRGENVDDRTVFAEAAADVWRRSVVGPDGRAELLDIWPTPAKLEADVAPLLSRPRLRVDGAETGRLTAALQRLGPLWQRDKNALEHALADALAQKAVKQSRLRTLLDDYAGAAALVGAIDARLGEALATGQPPTLDNGLVELAEPKRCINQSSNAGKACAAALGALAAPQPLAEVIRLAGAARTAANAAEVRALAETRKILWRQFSYDDLVIALHAALAEPTRGRRLAAALRAQWPYALVDEFQDTDPLQYASLARIYLAADVATDDDAPSALLLIGDPKQAIYAFRGGDVHAYLAAARAAGPRRYSLHVNFRSSQRLLDAVAALFQWPRERPFIERGIDYPAITAGRAAADRQLVYRDARQDGARVPALTVWQLTGGAGTKTDDHAPLLRRTVAGVAALLAGDIVWSSDDPGWNRGVEPRDIAVLVNTGYEAAAVQSALAAHRIAAVCQQRDSVFATCEASELALLLAAMAAPDDLCAVRSAETTALGGARLAAIIALADDDRAMQDCVERYQDHHQRWQDQGVLAALEAVFVAAGPAILALTDGERRMSNYLQLGELLAAAEPGHYGMAGLVHWLDREIAAAENAGGRAENRADAQLRLESDDALVRVATVHASKGLEYPIVFMPFALYLGAPSPARNPEKPPYIYHDVESDEPEAPRIDPIGLSETAKERARVETRAEGLRLLYVAATRAADALFLTWREPGDGSSNNAGAGSRDSALDNLLGRDHDSVQASLAAIAAAHRASLAVETIEVDKTLPDAPVVAAAASAALGPGRTDLPAPRTPWANWSFSRLAHDPAGPAAAPAPGAEDEWAAPLPSQAAATADENEPLPALDRALAGVGFGSAVHDLLEYAVFSGWSAPDSPVGEAECRRAAESLRRYGQIGDRDNASDAFCAQTAGLIAHVLHTPLPALGRLADIAPARLHAEMGFLLGLGDQRLQRVVAAARAAGYLRAPLSRSPEQSLNGLLQGFIDLVVEADGAYWIIDYKTNRLGPTRAHYHTDALAAAVSAAHYDLQYLLYTVALHRHLGRCLGSDYAPTRHLGGVQYLFVRAMDGVGDRGVFVDRPPIDLITELDDLLAASEVGP